MTLDEIRKLINDATPGPWEWEQDQLIGYEPFTDSSKGRGFAQTIIETDNGVYGPEEKDRRFIAAARTLLPALLDRGGGSCPEIHAPLHRMRHELARSK